VASSSDTDSLIGTQLGVYTIESVIGRGGMGVVYLADDPRLRRHVALKVISPELAGSPEFRERFLRETHVAASLEHPNIVPIHDAGETDGVLYLVMRHVEGTDLRELLREHGSLDPGRALALLAQVASALDAAHARGLVHRDVKPGNILVAEGEHAYIADFGLSEQMAQLEGGVEKRFTGSVAYVAPEQIDGAPVDGRADEYSLACVLFECLGGEPPFQRESPLAVLWAHLDDEPPALTERRPELAAGADAVVAKALAKEPDDRYPTCRELVEAAGAALGLAQPPARRRRGVVALLLAALVVVATLAIVLPLAVGGPEAASSSASLRPRTDPTTALTRDSVQRIDPGTNRLVATIRAPETPTAIAAGEGGVWVASRTGNAFSRIDPKTNAIRRITTGSGPRDVVIAKGVVWVLYSTAVIEQIDPASGTIVRTFTRDQTPGLGLLSSDGETVWGALLCACGDSTGAMADHEGLVVYRRQPSDVLSPLGYQTWEFPTAAPTGIAVGEGAVWVANDYNAIADVTRFDPESGTVAELIPIEGGASAVTVGGGAVWVANPVGGTVSRIDPSRNAVVERVPVGDGPLGIAFGAGAVWVANYGDGTVSRIDPATNAVVATLEVGTHPDHVAVGEGGVWVTVQA
jgi:serine/threonine-protein kinase